MSTYTRSRKTPVEAYGSRSASRLKKTRQMQSCTCRRSRPSRGIPAADDHSDDDANSPRSVDAPASGFAGANRYCAQCAVVYEELQQVDNAARRQDTQSSWAGRAGASAGRVGPQVGSAKAAAGAAVRNNTQLMGAPFTKTDTKEPRQGAASTTLAHAHAASSPSNLLSSMWRLQQAADWLAKCPGETLRVLQQHTLCHLEGTVTAFMGVPSYMEGWLGSVTKASDEASTRQMNDGVEPPPPLDLRTFLTEFLVVEDSSKVRRLLPAGRPRGAAPVSDVDLPYGTYVIEEALKPDDASATRLDEQTRADAGEWTRFFFTFWDPAKEGQCRDPTSFFCAILLACSYLGAVERDNRFDAIVDREVERYCVADDSYTHKHTCSACRVRQISIRQTVAGQCLTESSHRPLGGSVRTGTGVRFFLRTPAVVLWLSAFLELNRILSSAQQHADGHVGTVSIDQDERDCAREVEEDGVLADADVIPPGEAYVMRDWLTAAIENDTSGFLEQQAVSTLRIKSSSASNASVQCVCFLKSELTQTVARLSAWIDSNVQAGRGLRARVMLHVLREHFPVLAYYLSYFVS